MNWELYISRLNTSNFTNDQLDFYEKVKPLKRKLSIVNDTLNIVYNKQLFTLKNDVLTSQESNINFLCGYLFDDYIERKKYNITISLTDDGIVNIDDIDIDSGLLNPKTMIKTNENSIKLVIPSKVISINASNKYVHITTNNKENYYWDGNLQQIITPIVIIQQLSNMYLTDKGEVYIKSNVKFGNPNGLQPDFVGERNRIPTERSFDIISIGFYKVHGLPHIKQITEEGFVLSSNGDVYLIELYDLSFQKHTYLHAKMILKI